MIGIHPRPGSFTDAWIAHCREERIPFKIVDCYRSDIISQLRGCSGLLWHWSHNDPAMVYLARQLTYSLSNVGFPVFPNVATCWHFDDKVGQKYLLEASGAPLVPSHVFYAEAHALEWLRTAEYPTVFKLRGGAGSENVRLIRNLPEGERVVRKAFGRGHEGRDRLYYLKQRIAGFKSKEALPSALGIVRGVARALVPHRTYHDARAERGYAYFQQFIPDNDHDIRVVVIGARAFAIKRMVRRGDFRASGSGVIDYDPTAIPVQCLTVAFETCSRLGAQCLAFDFVFQGEMPLIVEVSYGFSSEAYLACPGYWDESLRWHEAEVRPEEFILTDFLRQHT